VKLNRHRLNDLGFVGRGRSRHRPRNAPHLYDGPYPFVQTGDIKAAGLRVTTFTQTYSEAGLEQSKMWPAGTLCITIAANIADSAILGIDACFPDSVVGFQADDSKCDVRYIKYSFDMTKTQYQQVSHGATQDNLSLEKLLGFHLDLPPLLTQHRIADILSAYDDAIENNRRRIKLLEDAARHLYEEWFVRLRFPGHEHVRIKGGVPEGWKEAQIGTLCEEMKDSANPNELDPETPYIGLEHIPRRSITLSDWAAAGDVTSTKRRYSAGDILFAKIRPYFHKVGITLTGGVTSSDAIVFRTREDRYRSLALMLLSSDRFVAHVSQTVREGSKMPRADTKLMLVHPVAVPPHALLEAFDGAVAPIVEQLRTFACMNRRLAAARDLLLPKLMSGEIAA
jgi:type I restriction enzyme, S subunit